MYNEKSRLLAEILEESEGRFFTVDFIKAAGTPRTLTGRLGVVKVQSGKGKPQTQNITDNLTVYDVTKKGYRNINRDSLKRIRVNGFEVTLRD